MLKKIMKIMCCLFILCLLPFIISESIIILHSYKKTYKDIEMIPKNRVGVVLGTSKYLAKNKINLYYKYRIDAAEELYKNNKVDFFIVSGDNRFEYYNEPKNMQSDLIERGIPKEKIYLDYAGFRTLDSIVRANAIFGQVQFTVISQKFHNERAIFIGKNKSLDIIGYNAKDVYGKLATKVKIRERLARLGAVIDIYIMDTKPKFLGEKIIIK